MHVSLCIDYYLWRADWVPGISMVRLNSVGTNCCFSVIVTTDYVLSVCGGYCWAMGKLVVVCQPPLCNFFGSQAGGPQRGTARAQTTAGLAGTTLTRPAIQRHPSLPLDGI